MTSKFRRSTEWIQSMKMLYFVSIFPPQKKPVQWAYMPYLPSMICYFNRFTHGRYNTTLILFYLRQESVLGNSRPEDKSIRVGGTDISKRTGVQTFGWTTPITCPVPPPIYLWTLLVFALFTSDISDQRFIQSACFMNKLALSWFSIKKKHKKPDIHIVIKPTENPDAKQTLHVNSIPHRLGLNVQTMSQWFDPVQKILEYTFEDLTSAIREKSTFMADPVGNSEGPEALNLSARISTL